MANVGAGEASPVGPRLAVAPYEMGRHGAVVEFG